MAIKSNNITPTLHLSHIKAKGYGKLARWWKNLDAYSKPILYIHFIIFFARSNIEIH
jgi:hypothetical protein